MAYLSRRHWTASARPWAWWFPATVTLPQCVIDVPKKFGGGVLEAALIQPCLLSIDLDPIAIHLSALFSRLEGMKCAQVANVEGL
jgi:hypothetical protein